MYSWHGDRFETFRKTANEAIATPEWEDYVSFCGDMERGLRKQALESLERFIIRIERSPFSERRLFVSWLCKRADRPWGRSILMPHPLRIQVVEPTLAE